VTFLVLYIAVLLGSTVFKTFRGTGQQEEVVGGLLGREVDRSKFTPLLLMYGGTLLALLTASSFIRYLIIAGLVMSVAMQGFVLITGLGGQVSLGQAALVGIGATTFARAAGVWHWPVALCFVVAALAALGVGLAVALPAIRVRGLPLALLTLAFGLFMDNYLFKTTVISGGYRGFQVQRFDLFGISLQSDRALGVFIFGVAFGVALLVRNLASGRSGRLLIATRNAEVAVEAFGTSVRWMKFVLFSMAAVLAGLAGALNALLAQRVAATDYTISLSLTLLTVAVLAGVSTTQGPLVAGVSLFLVPEFIGRLGFAEYNTVIFGLGAVLVLIARRGGLSDLLSRAILGLWPGRLGLAADLSRRNPLATVEPAIGKVN
jgi:ABC-type branched-subunit amino acid transport system permease subunit